MTGCHTAGAHISGISLASRTGCSQSVVVHTYTLNKELAFQFREGSLPSCPQGFEDVSGSFYTSPTAGVYFIAGIVLNLPAYKSITSRCEGMFSDIHAKFL